jgi:hypothetical protein
VFELNRWRWLGLEFTVIVLGILSALFAGQREMAEELLGLLARGASE